MSTPSLFEPPSRFDREGLASALERLAKRKVWIGTSSWKYEGWMGQIYTRERYLTRGRFSRTFFESACLGEYAETFPIVCGDFSFYQFPSPAYWQRLFRSASTDLLYAFKAPEDITVKVFPSPARYGPRAGTVNPSYLSAALFEDAWLGPLEPYKRQIATLILEFGTFSSASYQHAGQFLEDLDQFLAKAPRGWRYSIEVRNAEYLGKEYFQCLHSHEAAHVFNGWTRMPGILRQMAMPGAFTADFFVCRALLSRGRSYEQAVKRFSPYEKVQEPDAEARQAVRELIGRAQEQQQTGFIFVNNRLEGNAPETIQAVLEEG